MSEVRSQKPPELIVALDVSGLDQAKQLVEALYPTVKLFKVGSQLFTASGPEAIKMIGGKGGRVFLDLKFFDIPNTVYSAVASGTSSAIAISSLPTAVSHPVFMMTLHTLGGKEMLKASVKGASEKAAELKIKKPYLIGVTMLTSEITNETTSVKVLERARLAQQAGLDGVVCAAAEAKMIRAEFGEEFIIVTPGIRPAGLATHDQKRTATVTEAAKAGSNYLVIGRPILQAKDPLKAAKEILKSL